MGAMEAGARRDIYEQVGDAHVFGSSSMQTREWGFCLMGCCEAVVCVAGQACHVWRAMQKKQGKNGKES